MDTLVDFHFLRPWFLLLLPALAYLCYWLNQQSQQQTGFEQWINPQLLTYISTAEQKTLSPLRRTLPYWLIALAWLIATVALAGPTWKQLPQPLHQSEQTMIVVLDLSPSMLARDNKPSRIVRARLKIQDLLTQRKDGLTALVVYAGEAHIVTPLTDDNRTIINLLPTLTPGLLPIPGSNVEMAMKTAKQLMSDSDLTQASVVLVTDGVDKSALASIKKTLGDKIDLYIIGIGTEKGAPIPTSATSNNEQGGFLRDDNNQIITVRRNEHTLKTLAADVSGYYLPLQADNSDIQFIMRSIDSESRINQQKTRQLDRNMDQWEEIGPLLLLIFLPFFAFIFRRNWLLIALLGLTPMMMPETAHALSWDDIWLNKNQRAQKAFTEKKYDQAENDFTQQQWQGSAAYKNKNYPGALEAFSQGDTAIDHYNKGNALSYLGEYDKAIKAYETALIKDPTLSDAKKNKKIIEALKEQQEKEQQDGEGDNKEKGEKNQPKQEQDKSAQNESQSGAKNGDPGPQGQEGSEQDSQDKKGNNEQENSSPKSDEEKTQDPQENSGSKKGNGNAMEKAEQDAPLAELSNEEKQEIEQWIRKIPDDPSGLLRRKFEYEYQKRRQLYQSGQWTLPDNNAHQRY